MGPGDPVSVQQVFLTGFHCFSLLLDSLNIIRFRIFEIPFCENLLNSLIRFAINTTHTVHLKGLLYR